MPAQSAGILLYRRREGALEVLLAHPGGPFWARRDAGAWTLPKGEYHDDEPAEVAARREFAEETGMAIDAPLVALGRIRQAGGKWVSAFAAEGDFDVAALRSNTFEIEWPPRSGRRQAFAEIDRADWFDLAGARVKLLPSLLPLLDRLEALLATRDAAPAGA